MTLDLAKSPFIPIAIGFFGLGTGYFIFGGQALFGYPRRTPELDRAMGMWGIFMPGFMQFVTGVYLMVGLSWWNVYKDAPLYMAALAFTAYGVHWFVLGYERLRGTGHDMDAWMAIPFLIISVLGMLFFFAAGDAPVGILFLGLSLIYLTEIPTRFGAINAGRLVAFWQFLTGWWLMYLTCATTVNVGLGGHWWL